MAVRGRERRHHLGKGRWSEQQESEEENQEPHGAEAIGAAGA
jgi:hypothetical protein